MWKFVKSATNPTNWLVGHESEVCFIGRSNVGKSSLINALANQKKLARTSNTPGRTQLINFFQDESGKMIVDLPGYGYAKMSKTDQDKMLKMIQGYFRDRQELLRTFVLVDAKVGPTDIDIDTISYLQSINRDIFLIVTKVDKPNQSEYSLTLKKLNALGLPFLAVSTKTNKNISELKELVNNSFN